jgi:Fe-S oxidoreductase
MKKVKRCWDPYNVFNMNKIVDAPGMDEWLRFDLGQPYVAEGARTVFNWRAAFDECKVEGASGVRSQIHALMCSVEQCNGAGDCRKSNLIGGTMCPVFKATRDELDSTRARANILRECLTRGEGFTSPEVKAVLDSCLACKGCRAECPSNVDMTKIRAEVLEQIHQREGTPLRSLAVARMATIERLGHLVRPLYNFMAGWSVSAALLKRILGFAAERRIPALGRYTFRQLARRERTARGENKRRVYIFADEFTNYQEARIGLSFVSLLSRMGYDVVLPRHLESGRAAISKGCLKLARRLAIRNVRLLHDIVSADAPLVGIEPSCILSFRDEYPDLVPQEMRQAAVELASNCLLFDEFIMREAAAGRIPADAFRTDPVEIWLHGHCHQKALVGVEKTASALRLLPGARVHVIPSGCCGMAGSFGYEKEHYRRSIEIGEMVLFPAVRKAVQDDGGAVPVIVSAPGTSCRQQILDGTGVHAVHPVEILCKWLR